MTNGEKIKEIFPYLKNDKTDLVKVLNIDNLKSWWNAEYKEPTTKNDLVVEECVSRRAALEACHNFAIGVLDDYYEKCLKQWIIDLPPVTPIRPKGHWIESDYGNMITQHRWYCSECGGIHNDPESGEWREVFDFKYDYCPLCGADMREVKE